MVRAATATIEYSEVSKTAFVEDTERSFSRRINGRDVIGLLTKLLEFIKGLLVTRLNQVAKKPLCRRV